MPHTSYVSPVRYLMYSTTRCTVTRMKAYIRIYTFSVVEHLTTSSTSQSGGSEAQDCVYICEYSKMIQNQHLLTLSTTGDRTCKQRSHYERIQAIIANNVKCPHTEQGRPIIITDILWLQVCHSYGLQACHSYNYGRAYRHSTLTFLLCTYTIHV